MTIESLCLAASLSLTPLTSSDHYDSGRYENSHTALGQINDSQTTSYLIVGGTLILVLAGTSVYKSHRKNHDLSLTGRRSGGSLMSTVDQAGFRSRLGSIPDVDDGHFHG